jgi:hypothetical protein
MKNAHERFGWLEFEKQFKDTRTRVRVQLDRFIAEQPPRERAGVEIVPHLVSVFGNDVDVGAVWAAVLNEEPLTVGAPETAPVTVRFSKDARTFRGSIAIPGRRGSVRHLIAASAAVAGETDGGRTILGDAAPDFVLYQLSRRLGLPTLPEWRDWFSELLAKKGRIEQLAGIGCKPVAVVGMKQEFLDWIGCGLRSGEIRIPDQPGPVRWPPLKPFPFS